MPYSALLKGRVSIVGQYYVATIVTRHRQPYFESLAAGRIAIRTLQRIDLAGHSHTLACVVMPDHVHWLLQLTQASLSNVVGRFKGGISRELNRCGFVSGPPWQRGFHDHAVRSDESLERLARYVIENPVRAGLASSIGEYPLWYSVWDVPF